jgi:hypothetical protein
MKQYSERQREIIENLAFILNCVPSAQRIGLKDKFSHMLEDAGISPRDVESFFDRLPLRALAKSKLGRLNITQAAEEIIYVKTNEADEGIKLFAAFSELAAFLGVTMNSLRCYRSMPHRRTRNNTVEFRVKRAVGTLIIEWLPDVPRRAAAETASIENLASLTMWWESATQNPAVYGKLSTRDKLKLIGK